MPRPRMPIIHADPSLCRLQAGLWYIGAPTHRLFIGLHSQIALSIIELLQVFHVGFIWVWST